MSECQSRNHIEISQGDIGSEVWSGILGTVIDVDQSPTEEPHQVSGAGIGRFNVRQQRSDLSRVGI